jgi:subtilisin family serine protease
MMSLVRIRAIMCFYVAVNLVATSVGGPVASANELDGKYIVIYANGISLDLQKLVLTTLGVEVPHVLTLINALGIKIPLDLLGSILQLLLNDPNVVGVFDDPVASLDYTVSITAVNPPAEEVTPWGLERVNIPYVHESMVQSPGNGVTVAILDTGIDQDHPELKSRIVQCVSVLAGRKSCNDDNGHGTHIAGIIAAGSNHQGVIGAAPLIKLAAIKVLDANGAGHASDCIHGLQVVHSKGYRLVNMSLGFPEDSVPLKRAVDRVAGRGTIMVASVGNTNPRPGGEGEGSDGELDCDPTAGGEGSDSEANCYRTTNVKFPAAYRNVIGVGATDSEDRVTNYSRIGSEVTLVAPGGSKETARLLSTNKNQGYGEATGTSQAAAHVTGGVALAIQHRAARGLPPLSIEDMQTLLQNTAIDLDQPPEYQGAGLLDVSALLNAMQ